MKYVLSIIVVYLIALFQTSFLVHFSIFGWIPNLLLLLVILWNIFEDPESKLGVHIAFISGFFLDVFSNRIIGFNILILVIVAIFLKLILNKYVRLPFKKT